MNKITSKKTLSCLTVLVGITFMGTAVNALEGKCEGQDENNCLQFTNCTWETATCIGTKGVDCSNACTEEGCHMKPLKTPHCVDITKK